MTIQIEKGIPIPPTQRDRETMFPFDRMEVGDSFLFLVGKRDPKRANSVVSSACCRYKRSHPGYQFSARLMPDKKGIRVWRVPTKAQALTAMAEAPRVHIHLIADDDEPQRAKGGRR